ncbi:SIR2-like domain protein [anaerobic digester metagenome]
MAKVKIINSKEFKSEFKKMIESSNINLLLGAGFAHGIVDTLGDTEKILEVINKNNRDDKYTVIEAFIFWKFFEKSIYPLCHKINELNIKNQIEFIRLWRNILNARESAVINKQANIFTTNYDVVLEYALESNFIDYNDGFKGRINPYFSTANFNRLYFERAIFTNRSVEVPIFNLMKLHGSVTWKIEEGKQRRIVYNEYIKSIEVFYTCFCKLFTDFTETEEKIFGVDDWCKCDEKVLDEILPEKFDGIKDTYIDFVKNFKDSFKIVNPTKQKFSDTLMDKNYYELMRIYSNELEKNNTVLITQGFSFEDEHIQEITMRALGNPSLMVIIFAFRKDDIDNYCEKFEKFQNVWVVKTDEPSEDEIKGGKIEHLLDLPFLNKELEDLFGEIKDE